RSVGGMRRPSTEAGNGPGDQAGCQAGGWGACPWRGGSMRRGRGWRWCSMRCSRGIDQERIMRLTGQYWPGVIVGLMLGPALVELELLTPSHKVWSFGLGIILFGVGNGLGRHIRKREAAETT